MVFRKTISLLICTFLMFGLVSAQDLQQDAGITPDSPLWGLDKAIEQLRYAFTLGSENKAAYGILIAEERLAEIEELNKIDENGNSLVSNAFGYMDIAEQERQRIINRLEVDSAQLQTEARQRIQERLELHISNEEKIREGLQSHIQDKIKNNNEILERIKKQGGKK